MKLALVSDFHGQSRTLDYLKRIRLEEKLDALVASGDLTHAGMIDFAEELLLEFEKFKSVFAICGNADLGAARELIESSKYSINQKCRKQEDNLFCGLSFGEERVDVSEELGGSIFITHQPPVRALMDKKYPNSPKIHISGHIHKAAFVKKYVATTHIQVPTLQDGRYAILDTLSSKVEFKILT